MPSFDIIKKAIPDLTFRVASIIGTFDLQNNQITEHFMGEINLPETWNIGAIIGASGTGKTTIAKHLFPDFYFNSFSYSSLSILDDMPETVSVKNITEMFSSCGFSSPPNWLKSYDILSQGEKMRVDLARALLSSNDLLVFDEFTSVVDRQIAKIGSYAVQKIIRRENKKFIALSCHYDIIDWLLPDWIFDTNEMIFKLCSKKKDQISTLKFMKEISHIGKCLLDTII